MASFGMQVSLQAASAWVSRSVTSYDLVDSDFATLSAESDARKRAVRQISEDIKIRLGIYFSAAPGGV